MSQWRVMPSPHCRVSTNLNFPTQARAVVPCKETLCICETWYLRNSTTFQSNSARKKLLKAALLFEMVAVPDGAAESFLIFRPRFEKIVDVEAALQTLPEPPSKAHFGEKLSYKEFTGMFAADDPHFYQPPS
jgi:hypothetical protein